MRLGISIAIFATLLLVVSISYWLGGYGDQQSDVANPVPVSPHFQDKKECEHHDHEWYGRVPILEPLPTDGPIIAMDPPSDDHVMVAFEQAHPIDGNVPIFHEVRRKNIRIVKDLVADYIDPPRVLPLLGPVQQHHSQWKCTVYFVETTCVEWPAPYSFEDQNSVEVVYIEKNHFHLVRDADLVDNAGY